MGCGSGVRLRHVSSRITHRGVDNNGLGLDHDVVSTATPVSVSAATEAPEELRLSTTPHSDNGPTHHGEDEEEEDDAGDDTARQGQCDV